MRFCTVIMELNMDFKTLKDKSKALLVLAPAALVSNAYAGDMSAAVTAASSKITDSIPDVVSAFTAIIGLGVVVWVGRRIARILG